MRDPLSGVSKRYGFVTFMRKSHAAAVVAQQRLDFFGKYVEVGRLQVTAACAVPAPLTLPSANRVYVGNLPRSATEALMMAFFSVFGPVCEFKIVYDPVTGDSRRFGFVGFVSPYTAEFMRQLGAVEFLSQTLTLGPVRETQKQNSNLPTDVSPAGRGGRTERGRGGERGYERGSDTRAGMSRRSPRGRGGSHRDSG